MTAAPQATPLAERRRRAPGSSFPRFERRRRRRLSSSAWRSRSSATTPIANINNVLVLTGRWPLTFTLSRDRLCFRVPAPDGARRLAGVVRPGRFDRGRRHGRRVGAGGARGRGRRAAVGARGSRSRAMSVRSCSACVVLFPLIVARPARAGRLAEVDQQLRRPDPDLCDAGLGTQHRGRPRRPARSRLRRLLRRRRLFLRAAVDDLRPVVLDLPAAGGNARGDVGTSFSAFRCCGCAATIWRSSPWRSARSSASS